MELQEEMAKADSVTREDNQLLTSELQLLEVLKQKIAESNGIVQEVAKGDRRVKLLKSIPGLDPFLSGLVAKEIDDINRFRDEKKLCATQVWYRLLMPREAKCFTAGLPRQVTNG